MRAQVLRLGALWEATASRWLGTDAVPGPRVRSPRGLGAASLPEALSPLRRMGSHLAQQLPEEDSGVTATPPAAAWSGRRVWVSLEGRELGTLSLWLCPGSEGPVHPGHGRGESLRSAHRARPCQRRGRGFVCRVGSSLAAVTHPRHMLSGEAGCPAPPHPAPSRVCLGPQGRRCLCGGQQGAIHTCCGRGCRPGPG